MFYSFVSCAVVQDSAAFRCDCAPYTSGSKCDDYRRCFLEDRVCFITRYTRKNYHDALTYCRSEFRPSPSHSLSLPFIYNPAQELALREFLDGDPSRQLQRERVWLSLLSDDPDARWTWLDELERGNCYANVDASVLGQDRSQTKKKSVLVLHAVVLVLQVGYCVVKHGLDTLVLRDTALFKYYL